MEFEGQVHGILGSANNLALVLSVQRLPEDWQEGLTAYKYGPLLPCLLIYTRPRKLRPLKKNSRLKLSTCIKNCVIRYGLELKSIKITLTIKSTSPASCFSINLWNSIALFYENGSKFCFRGTCYGLRWHCDCRVMWKLLLCFSYSPFLLQFEWIRIAQQATYASDVWRIFPVKDSRKVLPLGAHKISKEHQNACRLCEHVVCECRSLEDQLLFHHARLSRLEDR